MAAFVEVFSEPIAQSVPHIYICALLFSPPDSLIRQTLPVNARPLLISHQTRTWDTLRPVSPSPKNTTSDRRLLGSAFSFDGLRFIYICDDGVLRVWYLHSGDVLSVTLDGFQRDRRAEVAFSADGTQLVADTPGYSLQVWDTQSGARIGASLRNHKGEIYPVTFSFDGALIAFGQAMGRFNSGMHSVSKASASQ